MTGWYLPVAVISSVLVAHSIKETIHIIKYREFSWFVMFWQTGGMPSSHSAAVSALTVAIFIQDGFSSTFWIALVLASIVMRDAAGVRRSVSDQAKILNLVITKMQVPQKVKVVLGHTPVEVLAGAVLGTAVALLWWQVLL